MPKFAASTLRQLGGFDGKVLAQEIIYGQKDFYNIAWLSNLDNCIDQTQPIPLTNTTVDAQIKRRKISNFADSRTGLVFDIGDYSPEPATINLLITNKDEAKGTFTLVLDTSEWNLLPNDLELDLGKNQPVLFTGRIKVHFPAVGTQPPHDEHIYLMFLVKSDGVIN